MFSPEDVTALARAAVGEQDAAIFLTAAWTGLRQDRRLGRLRIAKGIDEEELVAALRSLARRAS